MAGENGPEVVESRRLAQFRGGETVTPTRDLGRRRDGMTVHVGTIQGYTAEEVAKQIQRQQRRRESLELATRVP